MPLASYIPSTLWGNILFTSGQLPTKKGKLLFCGKLGEKVSN